VEVDDSGLYDGLKVRFFEYGNFEHSLDEEGEAEVDGGNNSVEISPKKHRGTKTQADRGKNDQLSGERSEREREREHRLLREVRCVLKWKQMRIKSEGKVGKEESDS
jgi:hypothetical protein